MTMRSGTNKVHGSAFEYFRNEALDANPPYRNYDTEPDWSKPRDRQHDWGLNAGGPVYLPKVYDGRDKTFFFYSFEQNRLKNTTNSTYTLPAPALQNGHFSQFLGAVVGQDPEGRDVRAGTIFDPSTTKTLNGVTYRDPFMGCDGHSLNHICMATAAIDPGATRYQSYYPSGITNDLINNYKVTWPAKNVTTINAFKIDHNLSSKLIISGYYSLSNISVG